MKKQEQDQIIALGLLFVGIAMFFFSQTRSVAPVVMGFSFGWLLFIFHFLLRDSFRNFK